MERDKKQKTIKNYRFVNFYKKLHYLFVFVLFVSFLYVSIGSRLIKTAPFDFYISNLLNGTCSDDIFRAFFSAASCTVFNFLIIYYAFIILLREFIFENENKISHRFYMRLIFGFLTIFSFVIILQFPTNLKTHYLDLIHDIATGASLGFNTTYIFLKGDIVWGLYFTLLSIILTTVYIFTFFNFLGLYKWFAFSIVQYFYVASFFIYLLTRSITK